jgi:very-short-patch-repair endonuclease
MRNPIDAARRQRSRQTSPERLMWDRLRGRRSDRPKVRRQHPMGPYVLDFYCPDAWPAIELDGWHHGLPERQERDQQRDEWLRAKGVETLRIPVADVHRNADEVAERIWQAILERGRAMRSLT